MIASVLILAVSLVLLAYWFRYSCLLLIRADEPADVRSVASRNQLSFVDVQTALAEAADLDALERSLEKDYRLLSYLLEHSAGVDVSGIEQRMLVLDYRLMQMWYRLVRRSSVAQARSALGEMAGILGYFAGRMDAPAAQRSAA